MNLDQQDIKSLQHFMQKGVLKAFELCEYYLDRIEKYDRQTVKLNSIIELNPDALKQAEILDQERLKKNPRSKLHGIPILLKDNIDTADRMATSAGSLALKDSFPENDAYLVQKLRNAGAVILGKTNLSEWANFRSTQTISGWSSRGGQTCNPYDPLRNPSGSSSGSAVAVAAGFCAAAIGTETDGSILGPASTNGVVGLKPNVGRISRRGLIPISHSQDTPGTFTRNVADAAILLEVLSGRDKKDPFTLNAPEDNPNYSSLNNADCLNGWTIGVVRNLYHGDPRVENLLDDAIKILKELGAKIKDYIHLENTMSLKIPEREVLLHEFKHGLNLYLSNQHKNLDRQTPRSLEELIAFNENHNNFVMPFFGQDLFEKAINKGDLRSEVYLDSLRDCRRLSRKQGIDAILEKHELNLFIANTAGPAWFTDQVLGDPVCIESSYTPSAVAGYPGISIPLGFLSNLPVGISFHGGAWSEKTLLHCANIFGKKIQARIPPDLN